MLYLSFGVSILEIITLSTKRLFNEDSSKHLKNVSFLMIENLLPLSGRA